MFKPFKAEFPLTIYLVLCQNPAEYRSTFYSSEIENRNRGQREKGTR